MANKKQPDQVKDAQEKQGVSQPIDKPTPESHDFPVVGIGASAGGLEAFGKFLSNLPIDTGMAFVLIQHLDPTHTSNMVELLKRYTKMPVHEATENVNLEQNHVYMIPPNRNMTITDHNLKLMEQLERPGIMHSIDLFFRSLANDLKEKAICIILSGTGTDGSLGARAVKAELGMVMVQDPETAAYDGMPRSAINSGVADFVLPAEKMGKQLVEYVEKSYGKHAVRRLEVEKDSATVAAIHSLIRARTRHDFSGYKQSTVTRRIERRMGINRIDNLGHYVKYLKENPAEVDALIKDFLINVTSFFRDPEAFAVLKQYIIKFLQGKPEGEDIRAWVPGCSTGEEAYSLAMLIEECQEETKRYYQLQVFGTDLDPDAIAQARSGIYSPSIAHDISEERLKKFFTKHDDQFQVKRELREKLIFAVQDIITDPPFTRMDIISTRNLLIYFDADLQKRLIPMFHYALNKEGILFLGTAETVGEFADLFIPLDRKWKIYHATPETKQAPLLYPRHPYAKEPLKLKTPEQSAATGTNAQLHANEEILLEALPPSVLLDSNYQVIYAHGNLRKYLGIPAGKPNMNVIEMAHPEIRDFLAAGLHEASSKQTEVVREGGKVKLDGDTQPVRIIIRHVTQRKPEEQKGRLIVTFQDLPKPQRARKKSPPEDAKINDLEQELSFTRETLRSTIEEMETANEELRSANEEYQSTNEELQSANEELETSREELQALNEELSTLNTEHQEKIEELSTANDDLKNLLNSTGNTIVYLDSDLNVKRFTPGATDIFNLIASDIDRPINHITSKLGEIDIAAQAKKVLDTLVPVKDGVQSKDGKWYSMRILPYRTTDNSIAGVVVTFIDISEQERIKVALSYAETIVDTLFQPVIILEDNLKIVSANKPFYSTFNINRNDAVGKLFYEINGGQWDIPELRKQLEEVLSQDSETRDYRLEQDFPRIGHLVLRMNARVLRDAQNTLQRILVAFDVDTGRKEGIKS